MRKGQSSIEFLAVTGIGLLLIVGVTAVYLDYSRGNEDRTKLQQVTSIGQTLLEQAQNVYAWGKNSWTTVEVSMPDRVSAIYVVENNTLVFDVYTKAGLTSQPVFSRIPITGVTSNSQKSFVNNTTTLIHGGKTVFRVTSQGANVTIQAVS